MEQINIRVGDLIKITGIKGLCKVLEIKTDGVIAETEFGAEFVPCGKIWGCVADEKVN